MLGLMIQSETHKAEALLYVDVRSRAGLCWLRLWARGHITALKRRRKYRPRRIFDPAEATMLRALLDLEDATCRLLDLVN